MCAFIPNQSQLKVLESPKNLTVVAGAGSGKTATLIALIIKHLEEAFQKKEELSIVNILALTFTDKAATELNIRLGEAFLEKEQIAFENKEKEFWQKQIKNLEMAEIGTIHSYALNLIRKQSLFLNLSSSFKIEKSSLAFKNSINYIVIDLLAENDSDLQEILKSISLNSFSTTVPGLLDYLTFCLEKMSSWGLAEIYVSEIKVSKETIEKNIKNLISQLQQAFNFVETTNLKSKFLEEIKEALKSFINNLKIFNLENNNLENQLKTWATFWETFKKWTNKDWKLILGELENDYQEVAFVVADIIINPVKNNFVNLVKKINERLKTEKIKSSALNFDDILIFARRLLANFPLIRQKEIKKYKLIIIDEFQDTNRLQTDILAYLLISETDNKMYQENKETWNLLNWAEINNKLKVVGDPKQSIYRFRGAEANIMQSLEDTFAVSEKAGVLALDTNYRSQENLISFYNNFFKHYFQEVEGLAFTKLDEQNFKRPNLTAEKSIVWLKSSEKSSKVAERNENEAKVLALYLDDLFSGKLNVFVGEGDKKRLPSTGDVALLFRRFKYAHIYEKVLKAKNWPVEIVQEENILNLEEIKALIFIFGYLHNLNAESNLFAFLNSSFINLNENLLAKISLNFNRQILNFFNTEFLFFKRSSNFNEQMITTEYENWPQDFSETEINYLMGIKLKLDKIKKLIYRWPSIKILEKIMEDFNISPFLFSLEEDGVKKAQVLEVFLNKMRNFKDDPQNALNVAEELFEMLRNNFLIEDFNAADNLNKNSIKIMSVHKSKGLEFPIVVLPEMNYTSPVQQRALVMNNLGLVSFKVYNEGKSFVLEASDFGKLTEREEILNLGEHKRIFYVATTRAKDYLIFLGDASKSLESQSWADAVQNYTQLDSFLDICELSPNNFLESEKEKKLEKGFFSEDNFNFNNLKSVWEAKTYFLPVTDLTLALADFNRYYEEKYLAFDFYSQSFYENTLINNFEEIIEGEKSKNKEKISAADLGNIFHNTLENLGAIVSDAEILKVLHAESQIHAELLTKEKFNWLLEKVNLFYKSKIAEKFKKATTYYQELPFNFKFGHNLQLIISGFIDLLFIGEDGIIYIVDYKLAEKKPSDLQRYELQVQIYALALKEAGFKSNIKAYLYFAKETENELHEVILNEKQLEKKLKEIKIKLINLRKLNMLSV